MAYLPEAKSEALRALPGFHAVLDVVAERPGTYLVGGAVRDLMLGYAQFDYDVLVDEPAEDLAAALVETLGGSFVAHERFLTAKYTSSDGLLTVDIARARTETYAHPGALPDVQPASIEDDLVRRDFSVNAMAVALWHDRFGELTEFPDASADLMARVLRVTHERSFLDDPTRLLRLLRYGARLGFTAEPQTEELARQAVEAGAPSTVSGARIRDELLDLLAERSVVVAIESMAALGLDRALHPKFDADEYVVSRAINEQIEGLRQELLALALCSRAMDEDELGAWIEELKIARADARIVSQAVLRGSGLLAELATATSPAERDALLRQVNPETIVFALAIPGGDREAGASAREWLNERHAQKLEVSGADLRDLGIAEGPLIGRALSLTLEATLNGDISGRDEQLKFALDSARAEAIEQ